MAELNFPFPASVNQLYTGTNSVTYVYDGTKWKVRSLIANVGGGGGGYGYTGSQGSIGYTGSGAPAISFVVSQIDSLNNPSDTVNDVVALRFDSSSGFLITSLPGGNAKISIDSTLLNSPGFKTISTPGQANLVAGSGEELQILGGTGIQVTTDATATPKTLTITATGGGGGSSTAPIKTFNVLNEFTAPLMGKAVFVPLTSDTIRSVQLTNGQVVGTDLMVGLYRNNELLQFFTIPAGYYSYSYSSLSYVINTNDYLTVNVVAGSGINFSMGLYNI